jgi:hypothetical protein
MSKLREAETDEAIRAWYKEKFEALWKELKETPRGTIITKTTRKYVAQYFFLAGLLASLETE